MLANCWVGCLWRVSGCFRWLPECLWPETVHNLWLQLWPNQNSIRLERDSSNSSKQTSTKKNNLSVVYNFSSLTFNPFECTLSIWKKCTSDKFLFTGRNVFCDAILQIATHIYFARVFHTLSNKTKLINVEEWNVDQIVVQSLVFSRTLLCRPWKTLQELVPLRTAWKSWIPFQVYNIMGNGHQVLSVE